MAYYYKRVRELREDKDKTQEEIAKLLQVGLTTYRRWETGERTIPTNVVVELAKYYKVTTDYILELSDEERNTYIKNQTTISGNKKIGKITIS